MRSSTLRSQRRALTGSRFIFRYRSYHLVFLGQSASFGRSSGQSHRRPVLFLFLLAVHCSHVSVVSSTTITVSCSHPPRRRHLLTHTRLHFGDFPHLPRVLPVEPTARELSHTACRSNRRRRTHCAHALPVEPTAKDSLALDRVQDAGRTAR